MAFEHIIFPQFRDEQSDSKYPFADSATLKAEDGKTTFAKDVFIDATFYPIGGGTAIYISRVSVALNKIVISVTTVNPVVTVTASYTPLNLPATNILTFSDDYGRPAGVLIFNPDRIPEIYQWGFGVYNFVRKATEIVATAFIPAQEPGVRGLTVAGTNFVAGDVCLVGASGIVLRIDDNNVIRVDVVGSPLFQREICDAVGRTKQTQRFLSTINGCTADEFGNFTITATDRSITDGDSTVLRVYPSNFGLVIATVGWSEI
jgi:hypothetical protein